MLLHMLLHMLMLPAYHGHSCLCRWLKHCPRAQQHPASACLAAEAWRRNPAVRAIGRSRSYPGRNTCWGSIVLHDMLNVVEPVVPQTLHHLFYNIEHIVEHNAAPASAAVWVRCQPPASHVDQTEHLPAEQPPKSDVIVQGMVSCFSSTKPHQPGWSICQYITTWHQCSRIHG